MASLHQSTQLARKPEIQVELFLQQQYEEIQSLFQAQPAQIRRFIEAQARLLAEALDQKLETIHFLLPNMVSTVEGEKMAVAAEQREQRTGSLINRFAKINLRIALQQRFAELEHSTDLAISLSSRLIRHATAWHLVYHLLPAGREVHYVAVADEEIPTIAVPVVVKGQAAPRSALLERMDAVTEVAWEENPAQGAGEEERGELQVPYAPAAQAFYLPQWVAFDEQGILLLRSREEAEACIASMQRFMSTLHDALALTPYMTVDAVYQQKRYGMLGQLVNQGRALACYQAVQIIAKIQHRVAASDLNRGLSISLPYFDDQHLSMELREIGVIPFGRIRFLPVFIVRAMQGEKAKVAQDTRLSPSTRKHLLLELNTIERAFREQ